MRTALHTMWTETRPADPPVRVWRDWLLVAVVVPTAILEAIFRTDVVWRPLALFLCVVVGVPMLLWRRTYPLLALAGVLGAFTVSSVVAFVVTGQTFGRYTGAYILIGVYALFRWGSGREAGIGLVIMLVAFVVGLITDYTHIGDAIGGVIVFLAPAELGWLVRSQASSRLKEIEQARLREREQLARELHDTVAHHVSAIAIQAQAGQATADLHPGSALAALQVIEDEASRTLVEMRTMVAALRQADEAELVPQPGVADLDRIPQSSHGWLPIDVKLSGRLDDLRPSVDTALYRLAQESITNAARHARGATRVDVCVTGDADAIRLTVSDDGESGSYDPTSSTGYGLIGMTERAKLLGGLLQAGPGPDRGWLVTAVLPRSSVTP